MSKKNRSKAGLTDGEFEQLVDEGFEKSQKRRGGAKPIAIPDAVYNKLVDEGHDPRLTKTGMAFSAAISRCLGVKPAPLSDASVEFINKFDKGMREYAKAHKIDLREE